MKLSMWILCDWLRNYDPEPEIKEGGQVLRSARILSHNTVIERQNVYLAPASEFISSEEGKIICVQGQDYLLLHADDMDEVLNDIFDAFDYYNRWADGISEAIYEGCSAQELIDRTDPIFQQPLLVYNAANEIIGVSGSYPKGSLDAEWDNILENRTNSIDFLLEINELLKLQKTWHEIHKFSPPGTPYGSVYRGLFLERRWIGRLLLLEAEHALTVGETQLFESFAQMMERWAAISDKDLQFREETAVFRDLLEGEPVSREEIDHKLQMAGWRREDPKYLLRIEVPQANQEISRSLFLRLERTFPDAYVIYAPEVVHVLVNGAFTKLSAAGRLLEPLLTSSQCCAVASYGFTDVYHLPEYKEQCMLTCRYIPRTPGEVYRCADYALQCIHSLMTQHIPKVLRHPAWGLLEAYDREAGAELTETFICYLRGCCNMARTARELHLHRNSLLYRLNQIRELTGVDLEDADEREYLLISYYL